MHDNQLPLRVLLLVPDQAAADAAELRLRSVPPPGAEVAERCFTESRALQAYFKLRPDLVVLDCRTAADEPARFVGLLKRMAPGSCVVAVVPSSQSTAAAAARSLGAESVGSLDDLVEMTRSLARML